MFFISTARYFAWVCVYNYSYAANFFQFEWYKDQTLQLA